VIISSGLSGDPGDRVKCARKRAKFLFHAETVKTTQNSPGNGNPQSAA
jgi:hypothetical protein